MWATRYCYWQAHNVDTLHSLLPIQEPKQCNFCCITAQLPSHIRASQCNLYCMTAQPPSHTRVSQCNLYCITFSSAPRSKHLFLNQTLWRNKQGTSLIPLASRTLWTPCKKSWPKSALLFWQSQSQSCPSRMLLEHSQKWRMPNYITGCLSRTCSTSWHSFPCQRYKSTHPWCHLINVSKYHSCCSCQKASWQHAVSATWQWKWPVVTSNGLWNCMCKHTNQTR